MSVVSEMTVSNATGRHRGEVLYVLAFTHLRHLRTVAVAYPHVPELARLLCVRSVDRASYAAQTLAHSDSLVRALRALGLLNGRFGDSGESAS